MQRLIRFNFLLITALFLGSTVISAEKYAPGTEKEILPNAFFKESPAGSFPVSWLSQYNEKAGYRLIKDPTFKENFNVLEITNPEAEKGASIRTIDFPLPQKGKVIASAWAKGSGLLTLFLIRSDWKGENLNKTFQMGNEWRKYSFEIEIPKHQEAQKYFFMTEWKDKGAHYFAAPSLELEGITSLEQAFGTRYVGVPCGNLVMNPDFEMGWQGWEPRYFSPKTAEAAIAQMKKPLPEIKQDEGFESGNGLFMPRGNVIESLYMPLSRGNECTVSAYLKGNGKGKTSFHVLDAKWNGYSKIFEITEEWKRYSFTFKWEKPCYLNEAYLLFDAPTNCDMWVDKMQLNEGPLAEYSRPPVMVGVLSKSNVLNLDEKPDITLKAVPSASFQEPYSVKVLLKDEKDNTILENDFDFPANRTSTQNLGLPTNKYGLYRLYLKAVDKNNKILGLAIGRYAVVCDLPEDFQKYFSLKANVSPQGHPLEYCKRELPVWTRMGIGGLILGVSDSYSCKNPELVSLVKEQISYYKSLKYDVAMRVCDTTEIYKEMAFFDSEKGMAMWKEYIKGIVEAYKDSVRAYAYLGEVNIYSVRQWDIDTFKDIKVPPLGTRLMPPDKAFRYFKAASEITKGIDKSIKVVGPSICGEDYNYVRSFMECGAAKYMDVFGMDAYRAGPDVPEAYGDYLKLKNILKENGFNGPAINLEQYFGITVQGFPGNSETDRHYYTPWNEELNYAGVVARNFIQHAAAGIEWTVFSTGMQTFSPFWQEGGFPSMAGPALAAAVKILNQAGEGVKITRNDDLKAFVFPDSPGGPVMVIYSPLKDMKATIKIDGLEKAWDLMGNEFEGKAKSVLPLTCCPVYLKFPAGITLEKIEELYSMADIRGAGEPFSLKISISGNNKIAVTLINRTNKKLGGKIKLTGLPEGWKAVANEKTFPAIPAGEKRVVELEMEQMPIKNMGAYPVSVLAASGELFTGREQVLSPIFSGYLPDFKCDGDFGKWKNAEWTEISAPANLVYGGDKGKYDPELKAKIATAWNKEGFAAALIVDDKDFVPPPAAEGIVMYQFDSFQIYFDQLSDARPNQKFYNNDDVVYQVGLLNGDPVAYLEQGPEGRYLGQANTVQGIDRDVKVNIKSRDNKTYYEVFFPWHTLKYMKPRAGETTGFSIMIHDKDGKGTCGISLDKDSPYRNPSVWKNLILRNDK